MTKAVDRLLEPVRAVEATPEILATDTDIDSIVLGGRRLSVELRDALEDAVLELTIEGAPTLELTFRDPDNKVLRSGMFGTGNLDGDGVVANVRGVAWRLVGVRKGSGGGLTATFEDETVAALRGIVRKRVAPRGKVTRAQFIHARHREVQPPMKFVCPELNERQPIAAAAKGKGSVRRVGLPASVKVDGRKATKAQRAILETILNVGLALDAPRPVLVAAVAIVTQESRVRNLAGGDRDSEGPFQQRPSTGWKAPRNVEVAAREFFMGPRGYRGRGAIGYHRKHPTAAPHIIGLAAQYPATWASLSDSVRAPYRSFEAEAKRTVRAFLGDGAGDKGNRRQAKVGKYLFSIGPPGGGKGEDYWTGFQRLATEVEWRYFVVANVSYLASEPRLFAAKPILTCNEDAVFVRGLEFDVDSGMRTSEAAMTVDADLWAVPPGATVELEDAGPATGRWLVVSYRRSLLGTEASVSMRKPKPKRPEPAVPQENSSRGTGSDGDTNTAGVPKAIADAYAKAKAIDRKGYKYVYGGGHGSFNGPYDCSGAVSAVLHAAGKLSAPTDTVGLGRFGKSGKGKFLTVYVKPFAGRNGHTYMVFNMPGKGEERFEAHGPQGVGPGGQFVSRRSDSGYQARHIEGM